MAYQQGQQAAWYNAMSVVGTALRAIVVCAAVAIASVANARCPAGTRVYSLTVWSGVRVDGFYMRCTGDGEEQTIPTNFNENPGGDQAEGICAGTGGVKSMEWGVPDAFNYTMVYANITCLDNTTYHFANEHAYDVWNITDTKTRSCEEGKYLQGITYEVLVIEDSSSPYFIAGIDFMCCSSTLDPICTDCSADTTLKSDEDQPEYCKLPSCSATECCEPSADNEESESMATTIIIGVVITVAAAAILSGTAWMFKTFKKKINIVGGGVEGFQLEQSSSLKRPAASP